MTDQVAKLSVDQCYEAFVAGDFDKACFMLLLSKALGFAIILGACIVKVPQIIKVLRAKNVEGLSFTMFAIETVGYLITAVYGYRQGFPFSAYGETFLVLAQNFVLVSLLYWYTSGLTVTYFFNTLCLLAYLYGGVSHMIPQHYCPLVPFVPALGVLVNLYLMAQLDSEALIRLLIWTVLGLCIYFGYGIRYSRLNVQVL